MNCSSAIFLQCIRTICDVPSGPLPLQTPVFHGHERDYVLDAIDSTYVSSVGAYVTRFEDMLRQITGAKHVSACVNGTAALQVALHLAGVREKELVLTQSLSFVATANAIMSWYPLLGQAEASFKLGFRPISQALALWLRATPSRCRGCKHRDNADYQAAFSNVPE